MRGVNNILGQLLRSRTASFYKSLILASVVFLFSAASVAWGADQANKMLSVALDAGAANPTVTIKTAGPVGYRYTVYDSFEPTRVVVDFPSMELAEVAAAVPVNKGAIKEIRTTGFDLSSGKMARVEILLEKTVEYQVSLDGKEFHISFATDAAGAQGTTEPAKASSPTAVDESSASAQVVDLNQDASVLRHVALSAGKAQLESNGKIGKYQFFALSNPARLIVDVYGVRPSFKERTFVAEAGFDKVRVGAYNDKTRLVFDASNNVLPEHVVEARDADILVTWGDAKAASKADAKPVVAATPSASVKPAATPAAAVAPAREDSPVRVEAIDFSSDNGRSVVTVALSGSSQVSDPVKDGNLVRFEVVNASISRALRRTIDASAFPSAVTTVTPYTVTDNGHQNVRIAVDLKGSVPYALQRDGNTVLFVVDDGAYAEPAAPAASQVEIVAPQAPASSSVAKTNAAASNVAPVTANEMAVEAARYSGEKITLVFDSANVRSILQLIGDVSGLNILASSDVQGTVTLRLIDVPWDQALDLVLETAGLGKVQEGNVLRILPKQKITEIEQASRKEQIVAIEEGVLETRLFSISYASVDDMKGFLADIKTERGSIVADSRNKQLIVRDVPEVMEQMAKMIEYIDMPERQVMIEARIVEANTNFSRELGVKWSTGYNDAANPNNPDFKVNSLDTGLGGSFFIPASSPAAAGFATALSIGSLRNQLNIDLHLAALENAGEGKIISTPRVTTLNGEKALISQGTKIPFSSVGDTGTDVKFENAELKLEVTPEINPDGSILLEINVSNSAVGTVVPTATGNAVSIDEKKAESKVLVRNGQTTVIGGIFIETERDAATGVPVLMDVPLLGHLFKSTQKTRDRREMLIFITPRIVEI